MNLFAFSSLRLDDDLSYSMNVFHRFDAVDNEIHHDLLQLHAISNNPRKIGCQFHPDGYVVSYRLVTQEGNGLPVDLVDINSLSMQAALSELRADPANNLSGAFRISSDSGDSGAHFIQIRLISPEVSQADVDIRDGTGNRLSDFMSQGRR